MYIDCPVIDQWAELFTVRSIVSNAAFNSISVISWWSALLVEETGVPVENSRPFASH